MGLTGWFFLVLVLLAALAVFAVTVVVWPRLAVPGVPALARRVGLRAGVNLTVLLAAATALNDTYGFYADWTDLLGAVHTSTPARTAYGGGSAADAVRANPTGAPRGPGSQPPPLPPDPAGHQRVLRETVAGPASNITSQVVVV